VYFYHKVFVECEEQDVLPFVTLHHFGAILIRNKKPAHKLVFLLRKYIAISGEGPPTGGDNNKIPASSGEEPLAGGNN